MLKKLFTATLLSAAVFAIEPSVRTDNFAAIYEAEEVRSDYYEGMEGLTGSQLFDALHRKTGENYRDLGYGGARGVLYNEADNDGSAVYAYYSDLRIQGKGFDFNERGDQNQDGKSGDFVNCEHVWPQSKFGKGYPMRSDMHHLFPTLSVPNGRRSHYAFGTANNVKYQTSAGSKLDHSEIFEPWDGVKGNVARAMLYFWMRYHNRSIFQKGTNAHDFLISRIPMFMEWHKNDPVDEKERQRNEVIFEHQRNRNPFIDHPEFVEQIGQKGFLN